MNRTVEEYLAEVERRLPGGPRVRTDVIDELRDGLRAAIEDQPPSNDDDRVGHAIAAFGNPVDLAASLGHEIRLRNARRGALQMLMLFVLMGELWRLYHATIGTPETMIPHGWARPVFLTSIVVIGISPIVAQAGALLFAGLASLRTSHAWAETTLRWLTLTTLTALSAFGLSMLLIVTTVTPDHRLQAVVVGIPAVGLLVVLLRSASHMARYNKASTMAPMREHPF